MSFRDDTLAVQAHLNSIKNAQAGNKEAWLDLFAEDAVVHDPVGPSAHDPEGKGFKGKEGIGEFWDIMIATGNLTIVSQRRIACGEHVAACNVLATNQVGDMKTYIEMVVTYEVNEAGKVTSLKAYWDTQALSAQLAEYGVAI